MDTNCPVPSSVSYSKIYKWTEVTELDEGVHLIATFMTASKYCNWVLLYSWCYVRTHGFRDPCMKNWDLLNMGENNETYALGVQSATAEFLKYPDTDMLEEKTEVEKIYKEICDYCAGVVYTPPKPLPNKPDPIPDPIPPDPVDPTPDTPTGPVEPSKPTNWKSIMKIAGPILLAIVTAAGFFLPIPGWVKTVLGIILKAFGG